MAKSETARLGMECGGVEDKSHETDTFRFAHAVEHLVVVDLMERGVVTMPKMVGMITLGRTIHIVDPVKLYAFWIRKGIAAPEEEARSIENVVKRIMALKS